MTDTMATSTTRRNLIKGASAAGIAGIAASMGIGRPAKADETQFAANYDIVIVGAGGGGLFAALEAQEQGLSAIVLESEAAPISSTTLSEGYVTLCETEMQPEGRETLYQDLLDACDYDCQEDLVRVYADNAGEAYTKLVNAIGPVFFRVDQVANQSVPFAHYCESGTNITYPLIDVLEENGLEIMLNSRVTRLVQDVDRRITGVVLEDGTAYGANKGVIIATGDVSRNPDIIKHFGSKGAERIVPKSAEGNRGDGHLMAMFVGAGLRYMCAGIAPTAHCGIQTEDWISTYVSSGSMLINMNGHRYHRENDSYVAIMQDAMKMDSDISFQILDTVELNRYKNEASIHPTVEPPIVADTLEELGELIKAEYPAFDVAAYNETTARYNTSVAANGTDDEFGRDHIVGLVGDLRPLTEPPFYAFPGRMGADHMSGGLAIDADCRVLDVFGDPIEGLYAAGMVAGGLTSWSYMSGTCVGRAFIQGMVAVRAIAAE